MNSIQKNFSESIKSKAFAASFAFGAVIFTAVGHSFATNPFTQLDNDTIAMPFNGVIDNFKTQVLPLLVWLIPSLVAIGICTALYKKIMKKCKM